ncbi:MAG TPA: RidA family protein [Nitrososphaerales archaeon]|nr:RidA family protein [Nitrososphaerales archaeon]
MKRAKWGLGPVRHGGRPMPLGKGAVTGDFVFLSGAEARADYTDVHPGDVRVQTELARLFLAGAAS